MTKLNKVSMATIALAASLSMILAGCGNTTTPANNTTAPAADKPVDGGTVTVAQTTKWQDEFIPLLDGSLYTFNMWGFSFDSLMNVDNKLNYEPWIGQSYTWSNDHKTVTIKIDPNAKWSDGQPIVSADVLLFMNYLASKDYNTTLQGQYESLVDPVVGSADIVAGKKTSFEQTGGFKTISPSEFSITFQNVDAAVLYSDVAGYVPLPSHVLGSIPFKDWITTPFDKQPTVVSGAFIPTAVNGQSNVTYKANPNYWKGKPHIDTLVMKYVSEDVAPSLLQSGQIDLILNGLKAQDYLKLKTSTTVKTEQQPDMGFYYMGLKDKNPLFSDVRVRQAMEYAINRQALIQGVFKGLAQPINSPVPSVSWAAAGPNDGLNPYNYNPDTAKQLLDQAGFKVGADGMRIDPKTGKTAVMHLVYSSGSPTVTLEADAIQQDLKAVGLDVVLDTPLDFNTMFTKIEKDDPSIEMWLAGWGLGVDPDPRGLWGSTDSYNLGRWVDLHDDALIKATWADPKDFDKSYRKAQLITWEKYVNQQLPVIFTIQKDDLWAYTNRLHIPSDDWSPASGVPLNSQDWWVTSN